MSKGDVIKRDTVEKSSKYVAMAFGELNPERAIREFVVAEDKVANRIAAIVTPP